MKTRVFLVLTILFIFFTGSLFAQNMQELRFGVRTSGVKQPNSNVWYTLTPNQNSFMVIELSSDDFDTYLEVYDSNRNLLAENDDFGDSLNSKLEIYGTRGTTYLVKVRSYDSSESGSFRISASYKPAPHAVELRPGVSNTAFLDRGDDHWYSVRIPSAGILVVATTGDDVDTFLDIFDSSYKHLAYDDDSGEGYNASVHIEVEANQTYFIRLRSYDGSESGNYNIRATFYQQTN